MPPTGSGVAAPAAQATAVPGGTGSAVAHPQRPIARPPARDYPTPNLLRMLLVLTMVAVVLFTVLTAGQLLNARSTLGAAAGHVNQLHRIEGIRTELLRADASAAEGLLADRPAGDRPEYRQALDDTRVLLIEAAAAQTADRDILVQTNRNLDQYAALLEQARAGRGTPQGQVALGQAGTYLRDDVLPPLTDLVTANSDRVADSEARFPLLVAIAGGIAVTLLLVTAVVTTIRFRRVLNLGLAAALALIAVALGVAVATLSWTDTLTRQTVQYDIVTLRATAAARGHGYEARAQEAQALLARTTGDAVDAPWGSRAEANREAIGSVADREIEARLGAAWQGYEAAHAGVREAAGAGRWDDARARATGTDPESAGGRFTVFDDAVSSAMADSARQSAAQLLAPRRDLAVASAVTVLAGLTAIGCAVAGLRPRLREYQ